MTQKRRCAAKRRKKLYMKNTSKKILSILLALSLFSSPSSHIVSAAEIGSVFSDQSEQNPATEQNASGFADPADPAHSENTNDFAESTSFTKDAYAALHPYNTENASVQSNVFYDQTDESESINETQTKEPVKELTII